MPDIISNPLTRKDAPYVANEVEHLARSVRSPLRVDFAGGWLDVPRYAVPGAYVINLAISPLVTLSMDGEPSAIPFRLTWDDGEIVPRGAGLGTSAACHMLAEAASGCGWQDEAVIRETGLCCWSSGDKPLLVSQDSGEWLRGCLAIRWTGKPHVSADIASIPRDYCAIANASVKAFRAVKDQDLLLLADAINETYEVQLAEGMEPLAPFDGGVSYIGLASKYCGSGWGGYAMYLFEGPEQRDSAVVTKGLLPVEPYCR